jgi:hypothetical protein
MCLRMATPGTKPTDVFPLITLAVLSIPSRPVRTSTSIVETMTRTVLLNFVRDVLKAVSTIGKYTYDMNDPLARKMEALLGSFNRLLRFEETRGLKDAHLTDFFDRS